MTDRRPPGHLTFEEMESARQAGFRMAERTEGEPADEHRDKPTFAEVYDAHLRFVWRTIRRMSVTDHEVDDAMQDVFLIVHRKLKNFVPNVPVKHWLFRIAVRVARD